MARKFNYDGVNYITGALSPLTLLKNLIQGADYLARKGIGLVHTVEGVGFPRDIDVDMMRVAAYGLPQNFRIYFQTMNVDKVQKRKMSAVFWVLMVEFCPDIRLVKGLSFSKSRK